MNVLRLLPFVILALSLPQAFAAFSSIDLRPPATDGLITVDSNTGLQWLDLTETMGMSINDARASIYVTQDGFRVATAQEVEQLLVGAGLSEGVLSWHVEGLQSTSWVATFPVDPNTEAADASDALRSFFGITESDVVVSATKGRFLRYPGTSEVGYARATFTNAIVTAKGVFLRVDEAGADTDTVSAGTGVFLVRSEPQSALRAWGLFSPSDDLTTIDDNTELEWLDLTETMGMSVNDALASTYVVDEGFRVATAHEVDVLFESAGFTAAAFSPELGGLQSNGWAATIPFDPNTRAALASDSLRAMLGVTSTTAPTTFAGGLFVEESGSDLVGFGRAYLGSAFTTTKGGVYRVDAYPAGLDTSFPNYGIYLVRPYIGPNFRTVSLVPGENDHLVTRDLNTGLEWLDLTVTEGCSVDQVESSSLAVQNGFRVATGREVDLLFEAAGLLPSSIAPEAGGEQAETWTATFPINLDNQASIASIATRSFFGQTSVLEPISYGSGGWFLRETGSVDVGRGSATATFFINDSYSMRYHADAEPMGRAVSSAGTGVFLVRGESAVPDTSPSFFFYEPSSGRFSLRFRGAPNTGYLLKQSTDLDFAGPGARIVPPGLVQKGSRDGDYVITDADGEASITGIMDLRPAANFVGVTRP